MAYINIPGTDCIGDSLSSINANALNFDNRILSLEANRTSIVNSLDTLNQEVFNSNSVVQTISNTQNVAAVQSVGTNTSFTYQTPTFVSGITPLSLIRTTNTSRILIELTGGTTNLLSDRYLYTYFYISTDGGLSYQDLINAPVEVRFRSGGGAIKEPHYARGLIQPNTNIEAGTAISVQVRAKLSARNNWWHYTVDGQVPFTFTLTEIL